MAAERAVRKEDGEKLAKVKVPRLQSCRRRRRRPPSNARSSSGVRRPVHGDQCEDGSQRGTRLPRHCKVSARLCQMNTRFRISDAKDTSSEIRLGKLRPEALSVRRREVQAVLMNELGMQEVTVAAAEEISLVVKASEKFIKNTHFMISLLLI